MAEKLFMRDTWKPQSFDEESSSVRVVAVTENPVRVWDWNRKQYVDEVLLIDGFSLPPSGKIPLLDAHNRSSVTNVLGSARRFHPSGNALECDVFFSGTDAGRNAAQNVKEGHLTDFSVGYFPVESHFLKEGEEQEINGRNFRGPVKVTSRWNLRELSLTPIGADQYATARSEDGYMPPLHDPLPPGDQQANPSPALSTADPEQPGRSAPESPDALSSELSPERTGSADNTPTGEDKPRISEKSLSAQVSATAESPPAAENTEKNAAPVPEKTADADQSTDKETLTQDKARNLPEPNLPQQREESSERQLLPPPPPGKQNEETERSIVDMIFYAFLALMILFILKGLFL